MRVMNSTQHSIKRSRESFANVMPGSLARMSCTIFWTVAGGALAFTGRCKFEVADLWAATNRRCRQTRGQTWWLGARQRYGVGFELRYCAWLQRC
ncbi:hypothetical protein IG631_02683 [Alternaria alternata]|nr:hypothetical protein IG631_02683 [Alternaria alternata]